MVAKTGRSNRLANGFAVERREDPSEPLSVTATVCSKWHESEPSSVEIDQLSSCSTTSGAAGVDHRLDRERHPGLQHAARGPGAPKFGICGSSCIERPTPWPTRLRMTE